MTIESVTYHSYTFVDSSYCANRDICRCNLYHDVNLIMVKVCSAVIMVSARGIQGTKAYAICNHTHYPPCVNESANVECVCKFKWWHHMLVQYEDDMTRWAWVKEFWRQRSVPWTTWLELSCGGWSWKCNHGFTFTCYLTQVRWCNVYHSVTCGVFAFVAFCVSVALRKYINGIIKKKL